MFFKKIVILDWEPLRVSVFCWFMRSFYGMWISVCDDMDQQKVSALSATLTLMCILQNTAFVLFVSFLGHFFSNSYWNSYCKVTFGEAEN